MTFAISEFVQGLLPGLKKETVTEDLRVSIDNLDKVVIPTYDKISAVLRSKVKSEQVKEIEKVFNRAFKGKVGNNPNIILTIKACLPMIRANAEFVAERLEEILEASVVPEGLTSRKAAMIRAAKQISFISDFALDLANVVLICETLAVNGELSEDMEMSKGTQIRVERMIVRFAYAVTDFSKEPRKFEEQYGKMKDVFVGGANARNLTTAGNEIDIDPFESRLAQGVAYNPLYHFRIAVAQWQARRYHNNKEKKKVLELRVLQLKAEMERKGDPKIAQEINYTQSRIDKLDAEIRDAENDVGM